jgi:hypothetical protein
MTNRPSQSVLTLEELLRQPYLIPLRASKLVGVILLIVGLISTPLSISVIQHGNKLLGISMFVLFVIFCFLASCISLFCTKPRYVISPHGIYHFPVFRSKNAVFVEWQNVRQIRTIKIHLSQLLIFHLIKPTLPATMMRKIDRLFGYGDFTMAVSGLNYRAKILLPLINTLLITQPEQRRFVIQTFLDRH